MDRCGRARTWPSLPGASRAAIGHDRCRGLVAVLALFGKENRSLARAGQINRSQVQSIQISCLFAPALFLGGQFG
jgi:hypothetical protein